MVSIRLDGRIGPKGSRRVHRIPSVTTAAWQGAMAGTFAQKPMLTWEHRFRPGGNRSCDAGRGHARSL